MCSSPANEYHGTPPPAASQSPQIPDSPLVQGLHTRLTACVLRSSGATYGRQLYTKGKRQAIDHPAHSDHRARGFPQQRLHALEGQPPAHPQPCRQLRLPLCRARATTLTTCTQKNTLYIIIFLLTIHCSLVTHASRTGFYTQPHGLPGLAATHERHVLLAAEFNFLEHSTHTFGSRPDRTQLKQPLAASSPLASTAGAMHSPHLHCCAVVRIPASAVQPVHDGSRFASVLRSVQYALHAQESPPPITHARQDEACTAVYDVLLTHAWHCQLLGAPLALTQL